MGAAAVEAYLHETVAPKLLGRDPLRIEAINAALANYLGWRCSGVETRGNSAVDIALWDLFGKVARRAGRRHAGRALARLDPRLQHLRRLQVHPRRALAVGGQLARRRHRRALRGSRRVPPSRRRARALSLLEQGITGDEDLAVRHRRRAERRLRHHAGRARHGARAVREDPHAPSATGWTSWSSSTRCGACRWRRSSPRRLAEFDTYWHEDPFRLDNIGDLADYARAQQGVDLRVRDARLPRTRSASTSRPASPASPCSTSRGAAASPRRARSRRWPRPGTCRSRPTTAPGRSSTRPPATCRCTRRTR